MSRTRTFSITDRITGKVRHNVPSDELQAMFPEEWWDAQDACGELVRNLRNGVWYEDLEAYLDISVDLEDNE